MIYYYPKEVEAICKFLNTDPHKILYWLEKNKNTDKYLSIEYISSLGQTVMTIIYGKNTTSKKEIHCQMSNLGCYIDDKDRN